ncbi:MAG: DMT family transporter, partial [Thermoanaerobaculia bacterium]|nr:DMT family transporter [Thermoanaerobaculia bacterium]
NAVAYSVLDLLRKVLVGSMRPTPLLVWLSVGPLPLFVAWIAVAGAGRPDPVYFGYAAVSIVLNVVANLLFLEAVRVSPLSLTIPFLTFTPVFTTILAIPLLGEVPSAAQWIGIALIVTGAFRLNLESGERSSPAALWRAFLKERGSVLMVGVAFCWATASPIDKLAMRSAHPSVHGLALNLGVGLSALALLAARGRLRELRPPARVAAPMAGAIAVSVLGLAFLLLALNATWVGLVETLKRGIGSFLALLFGAWFFGERVGLNQAAAVALMVAGVALLFW